MIFFSFILVFVLMFNSYVMITLLVLCFHLCFGFNMMFICHEDIKNKDNKYINKSWTSLARLDTDIQPYCYLFSQIFCHFIFFLFFHCSIITLNYFNSEMKQFQFLASSFFIVLLLFFLNFPFHWSSNNKETSDRTWNCIPYSRRLSFMDIALTSLATEAYIVKMLQKSRWQMHNRVMILSLCFNCIFYLQSCHCHKIEQCSAMLSGLPVILRWLLTGYSMIMTQDGLSQQISTA